MNTQELFRAIKAGDLEVVRSLIKQTPDLIHARNAGKDTWDEMSPLHCSAKAGHLEIVKLLVERGAEVYSNPMCSYPPVMIAAWNEKPAVVDYFLKEIPDRAEGTNRLGITIHLAARQGWTDIVSKHIDADPLAVHQRGWLGDTPLHWPAHNGFIEIVKLLLDAGADIEADELNCYGGKPLHWASEHEPATTKLLLERGANVNSRNVMRERPLLGFTPLIMNASQKDDCAEVTRLLLDAGADVDATDANGRTVLHHATKQRNENIVAVLEAVSG